MRKSAAKPFEGEFQRSSGGVPLDDNNGDLTVGLLLVVGIVGIGLDGAGPPDRLFFAGHLAGHHVPSRRAVLELHLGIGEQVEVPDRVLWGTALGRHQGIAAVVLHSHQWCFADVARFRSLGGEQNHRQTSHGGSLGAAGPLVQLDLVPDPLGGTGHVISDEGHTDKPTPGRAPPANLMDRNRRATFPRCRPHLNPLGRTMAGSAAIGPPGRGWLRITTPSGASRSTTTADISNCWY